MKQEREELTSELLYKAITDMYLQKRYRQAFIIIDTCQSASLIPKVLEGD